MGAHGTGGESCGIRGHTKSALREKKSQCKVDLAEDFEQDSGNNVGVEERVTRGNQSALGDDNIDYGDDVVAVRCHICDCCPRSRI